MSENEIEVLKNLYWQVREDVPLDNLTPTAIDALGDAADMLHDAGEMEDEAYASECRALEGKQ